MGRKGLRVALVGGPMYDGLYNAIPQFERDTGITVEIGAKMLHPDLNDHIEDVYTRGAGDYDLIATHNKYVPSQKEWILPLDDHIGPDERDAFLPSAIEMSTVEGNLLGLPRCIDVRLLYYRRDLIEDPDNRARFKAEFGRELGVPQTWAEFGEVARCLASPPDLFGAHYPGRFSGLFGTWYELMAMAGGKLMNENNEPVFDDEAGRWALGFLRDLHLTWKTTPPNLPDLYYDDVAQGFCDGHTAMVTDWPGGYHRYCDPATSKVGDLFDVALCPEGPAGIRRLYSGMFMFAIPKSVTDLPAALALLRFLTNEENQFAEAMSGALAVRSSVQARVEEKAVPSSREERRLRQLSESANCMLKVPKTAWYPQMEDTLWQAVQSAIVGERSVEEALALAASQVGEIVHEDDGL